MWKRTYKINIINEEGQIALCSDSGCRATLTNTYIYIMDIKRYARLQDELVSISSNIIKNKDGAFKLFKDMTNSSKLNIDRIVEVYIKYD